MGGTQLSAFTSSAGRSSGSVVQHMRPVLVGSFVAFITAVSTFADGFASPRASNSLVVTSFEGVASRSPSRGAALQVGRSTLAYYVSPKGDDTNPGTQAHPFRTIEQARLAVQKYNQNMAGDIVVYLRGGEYRLNSPILFDHTDSGTHGHNVVYKAYPGEEAILTGGQRITGWEPVADGIYKARVGSLRFRQLYVNGRRAIRARTPNQGAYYRLLYWDESVRKVVVTTPDPIPWADLSDVEVVIQKHWNVNVLRVASASPAKGWAACVPSTVQAYEPGQRSWSASARAWLYCLKEVADYQVRGRVSLVPAEPERTRAFRQTAPPAESGQAYHLENAYEFLDAPGEWNLNSNSGEVYYKPRPGEDIHHSVVIAPRVETLLKVQGMLDAPVHDLAFEGLTFEYTTWLLPNREGFIGDAAGISFTEPQPSSDESILYIGGRLPAGVHLEGVRNVSFELNIFRHMGGAGITLYSAGEDVQFVGNRLSDISGNGISVDFNLEGNPTDTRRLCRRIAIRNNMIERVAQDYYGSVGIHVGYAEEAKIEHNEVRDLPYTGISVGWGWTLNPTTLHDNAIRFNHVHQVMNLLDDGGGIYTMSRQPGTRISENYIHDVVRSPWAGRWPVAAIYLDNGSDLIRIEKNVLKNVEMKIFLQSGGTPAGSKNVLTNNDWVSQEVVDESGLEPGYKLAMRQP